MRVSLFWRVYTPRTELRVGPVGCYPWTIVADASLEYRVTQFWRWWREDMELQDTVHRAEPVAEALFEQEERHTALSWRQRGVFFLNNGYTYDNYRDAVKTVAQELLELPADERDAVTAAGETSWVIYTSAHLAVLTFTENSDAWEDVLSAEDLGPTPLQTMALYAMAADVEDALSRLGEEEE